MNKQLKAMVIASSLLMPLGVMADEAEELTIRVMEMNENTVQAVTRNIELPDVISENAAEALQTQAQNRVRNRVMVEEGGDQLMLQEQERLRERLEEQERDGEQLRENAREQQEQYEQRESIQDGITGGSRSGQN